MYIYSVFIGFGEYYHIFIEYNKFNCYNNNGVDSEYRSL